MANNSFDYSKNSFNHADAFASMRFNSFKKAPKVDFQTGIEFLEDLEDIKKCRSAKALQIKLILMLVSAGAFVIILLLFLY
ncbi:MAG: hypothetical protein WBA74_26080 [Cyclobacteriaceae bacterium]